MRAVFGLWLVFVGIFPFLSVAQDRAESSSGGDARYELGFHLGNLLPNQIEGVTEIMGIGGGRMGFRLSPGTYFEGGMIAGNGEGAQWKNAHLDLRMDTPVESLVAIAYIGGDTVIFKGADHGQKLVFGGHAGGGIQAHMGGVAWFRGDMKFGFGPGTSLYIGFGVVLRMGGGGSGSGSNAG
jgi:hypothetical protein